MSRFPSRGGPDAEMYSRYGPPQGGGHMRAGAAQMPQVAQMEMQAHAYNHAQSHGPRPGRSSASNSYSFSNSGFSAVNGAGLPNTTKKKHHPSSRYRTKEYKPYIISLGKTTFSRALSLHALISAEPYSTRDWQHIWKDAEFGMQVENLTHEHYN